jgi:hypothetical protein
MTMRLFVFVLLLCNATYFAWSQGWGRLYGFGPALQAEPYRLENQINPSSIHVLSDQASQQLMAKLQAEKNPTTCLQAGPFDAAQSLALRIVLESTLTPEEWQIKPKSIPDRWIVYLGKFATPEALAKKKQELAAIQLIPQPLLNTSLELGLSLGHYGTEVDAAVALGEFSKRGLRTGRVVLEQPATETFHLILNSVTEAGKPKLSELKTALAGMPLQLCAKSGN